MKIEPVVRVADANGIYEPGGQTKLQREDSPKSDVREKICIDLQSDVREKIIIDLLQERARENLGIVTADIRFDLHEGTGRLIVKVIDLNTGETIREIPPHEFLDMVARIQEFVGYILDERV